MAIDATISEKTERGRAEERRLMQEANSAGVMLTDYSRDANLNRRPDFMVYVYSIVNRRFEVHRPPSFPIIVFEPCPEDEDYKLVGAFPSPVNEMIWMEDRTFSVGVDGVFFTRGVLNPSGAWGEIGAGGEMEWAAASTDLTRRGLFMSMSRPPKPEEVRACRTRMETHYRWCLKTADELDRANRRREIGPEHHLAADYFAYKANWHYTQTAPTPCPYCGELVRPGLAYHMNSANMMCVLDWRRAVAAGVKKMEDVPVAERGEWWKDSGQGSGVRGQKKRGPKEPMADTAAVRAAGLEGSLLTEDPGDGQGGG